MRARPVVGALVVAVVVALPLLAVVAGDAAAPAFDAAAHDERLARALAVAIVAAFATVGAAIASLAPDRALLGRQLDAAPLRPLQAFVGLTLLPMVVVGAPIAAVAATFAFVAAGRPSLAFAVVLGAACACAFGAAGAASVAGASRGSRAGGAAVVVVVVAGWLALGAVGGDMRLGPAAALAAATRDAIESIASLGTATLAAASAWALAAVRRPRATRTRAQIRVVAVRSRSPAVATAAATSARLLRNAQARRHALVGAAFAISGAVGVRVVVGDDVAPYFAAFVALLVAAACPLIAAGLRKDAWWLLRAAPISPRRVAAADACAGVLAGFVVVVLVTSAAAPLGRLTTDELLIVEVNAALILGAAAASSALLPWRTDRVLDQLASYALLAVVAALVTAALGRGTDVASAFGVPETVFAAVAAHLVLFVGIATAAALAE